MAIENFYDVRFDESGNIRNWKGLEKVSRNLNKEIDKIANRTQRGTSKALMLIRRVAQQYCPVDLGNLKNSAYVITHMKQMEESKTFKGLKSNEILSQHKTVLQAAKTRLPKHGLGGEVGFTANYALIVHEDLSSNHVKTDKKKTKQRQIGSAKFLERAMVENQNKIINIVTHEAKI